MWLLHHTLCKGAWPFLTLKQYHDNSHGIDLSNLEGIIGRVEGAIEVSIQYFRLRNAFNINDPSPLIWQHYRALTARLPSPCSSGNTTAQPLLPPPPPLSLLSTFPYAVTLNRRRHSRRHNSFAKQCDLCGKSLRQHIVRNFQAVDSVAFLQAIGYDGLAEVIESRGNSTIHSLPNPMTGRFPTTFTNPPLRSEPTLSVVYGSTYQSPFRPSQPWADLTPLTFQQTQAQAMRTRPIHYCKWRKMQGQHRVPV